MRKRTTIAVFVSVGLAITAALLLWCMFCADGTVYAPAYSGREFRQVKAGMKMSEVERRLGSPIGTHSDGGYRAWEYTDWDPDKGERYQIREVVFDERDRVKRTISRVFSHDGC